MTKQLWDALSNKARVDKVEVWGSRRALEGNSLECSKSPRWSQLCQWTQRRSEFAMTPVRCCQKPLYPLDMLSCFLHFLPGFLYFFVILYIYILYVTSSSCRQSCIIRMWCVLAVWALNALLLATESTHQWFARPNEHCCRIKRIS